MVGANEEEYQNARGTVSAEELASSIRKQKADQYREHTSGQVYNPISKMVYEWKNLHKLSTMEPSKVATVLKNSIIYDDGDVIAIDKPYWLPVHGGPRVVNNINSLLPILAKKLPGGTETDGKLHLIHRLDKETTGVMLLARAETTARHLNQLFLHRRITKRYWVVTVGIPDLTEGIIDIPLVDKEVAGKNRMVLKPNIKSMYGDVLGRASPSSKGFMAVTHFKVMSTSKCDVALIQLQPETGVKHQLRVHMSQGLNCPILGDHKYSHADKLAPQHLPPAILKKFELEKPKARYIPMHLHAKQIIIPDYKRGQDLQISARLPPFFVQSLRKLMLKIPK